MAVAPDSIKPVSVHVLTVDATSRRLDGDDRELVECLRAGENSCYETLVRRYGPGVLAIAKRYLRSEADAADCFQDTFLAVFKSIKGFEHRSSIKTWLRGITVNQCLMRIRAQARRREESIEHLLPAFDERGKRIDSFTSNQTSATGDTIDKSRTKVIVREKINELPNTYRIMLLLRDIDGYSTREAAAMQGISVTAAKTRLHRARSALKSLLEPVKEHLEYHADM